MKFLVDAQLPIALKELFVSKGYDCVHTLDMQLGNETPDSIVNNVSIAEQRVLITKDGDFLESFILKNEPYKLILVKLGNTSKMNYCNFFLIGSRRLLGE